MEEIQNIIEEIKAIREKIENFEVNPDDYENEFDDMLDEVRGEFMGYNASYILKQVDPTAYRCDLLDYVDGLEIAPDELEEELNTLLEELEILLDMEEEWCNDMIEDLQQDVENGNEEADIEITIYLERIYNIKSWREEYL